MNSLLSFKDERKYILQVNLFLKRQAIKKTNFVYVIIAQDLYSFNSVCH